MGDRGWGPGQSDCTARAGGEPHLLSAFRFLFLSLLLLHHHHHYNSTAMGKAAVSVASGVVSIAAVAPTASVPAAGSA